MPKCGDFVMILVSFKNVYKMFVLKIFIERECLERCFENANVRKFCNDSRIAENVYKMFVFEKCFEDSFFESVRCGNCFIFL